MMNTIEGGVTAAKGFMAASAEAGIKYKNRTDMALVYTESPAVCAGTFRAFQSFNDADLYALNPRKS